MSYWVILIFFFIIFNISPIKKKTSCIPYLIRIKTVNHFKKKRLLWPSAEKAAFHRLWHWEGAGVPAPPGPSEGLTWAQYRFTFNSTNTDGACLAALRVRHHKGFWKKVGLKISDLKKKKKADSK